MILRPYQTAVVEAVFEHLCSKENNPCVVLPTGTGKAVVLAQIAKDAGTDFSARQGVAGTERRQNPALSTGN